MTWKDNMGPDRAGLLADVRPRDARHHLAAARKAVQDGDLDRARMSYLKAVESWRQANELTSGAYQAEWSEATKEYETFVFSDPLYQRVLAAIESLVQENPGILQTELYKKCPDIPKDHLTYALYFAAKQGRILRTKKGRTYELRIQP